MAASWINCWDQSPTHALRPHVSITLRVCAMLQSPHGSRQLMHRSVEASRTAREVMNLQTGHPLGRKTHILDSPLGLPLCKRGPAKGTGPQAELCPSVSCWVGNLSPKVLVRVIHFSIHSEPLGNSDSQLQFAELEVTNQCATLERSKRATKMRETASRSKLHGSELGEWCWGPGKPNDCHCHIADR